MKIIDADRLKAEIERRIHEISHPLKEGYEVQSIGKIDGLSELLEIIDSLQQERPEIPKIETAEYYYHKGVCEGFSRGSADALKILEEFMKRKADPVIVIKQQEQPEVDLEKEISRFLSNATMMNKGEWKGKYPISKMGFGVVARHFFNLGLNARKEENK